MTRIFRDQDMLRKLIYIAAFGYLLCACMMLCQLCFGSTASGAERWLIDNKHSSVGFEVKHLMVSNVVGRFSDVSGTVDFDGSNLDKATVDAHIGVTSLDTHQNARDKHLRSKNVFDALKFPSIDFHSDHIDVNKDGSFKIFGHLSMHGINKEVVLDANPLVRNSDSIGKETIETEATAELNRKDFGISVDKTIDRGGAVVGDKVKVNLDICLVKSST